MNKNMPPSRDAITGAVKLEAPLSGKPRLLDQVREQVTTRPSAMPKVP
jgi:hypothetical protein